MSPTQTLEAQLATAVGPEHVEHVVELEDLIETRGRDEHAGALAFGILVDARRAPTRTDGVNRGSKRGGASSRGRARARR